MVNESCSKNGLANTVSRNRLANTTWEGPCIDFDNPDYFASMVFGENSFAFKTRNNSGVGTYEISGEVIIQTNIRPPVMIGSLIGNLLTITWGNTFELKQVK